jgi:hypothetical protein
MMNMRMFVIGEILDLSTGKRSDKFAYRVGRSCQLNLDYVVPGIPLVVEYPEREAYFRTSTIQYVTQDQDTIWVTTLNTQYVFHRED